MTRHRKAAPFRKGLRAVPARAGRNRPARDRGDRGFIALLVALPLAAFTVVFVFGVPGAASLTLPAAHRALVHDSETAQFDICEGRVRINCVVDGDTLWYHGEKIRIADINAPETHEADCDQELALGNRATNRLLVLLNQGPFTLAPNNDGTGRSEDQYGRALRVVTRGGASVGEELVSEGLAEGWKGYRGNWC